MGFSFPSCYERFFIAAFNLTVWRESVYVKESYSNVLAYIFHGRFSQKLYEYIKTQLMVQKIISTKEKNKNQLLIFTRTLNLKDCLQKSESVRLPRQNEN